MMRTRPSLLPALLLFCNHCDGEFVLGDKPPSAETTNSAGRAEPATGGEEAGSAGILERAGDAGTPGRAGSAGAPEHAGASGAQADAGSGGVQTPTPIAILPALIPMGYIETQYEVQLVPDTDATGDYTFELAEGDLPAGLRLASSGILSGIPTEAGDWSFVVEASDETSSSTARSPLQLSIVRSRWLASTTFRSSTSPQTNLRLVNLSDMEADAILLESEEAVAATFSPDGRWLTYCRGRQNGSYVLVAVDTSGPLPGAPVPLWDTSLCLPTKWSPDGSKMVGIRRIVTGEGEDHEIVHTDMSGGIPGSSASLGTGAVPSALQWLNRDELVYGRRSEELFLVRWTGKTAGAAQSLGIPTGVLQVSLDGTRGMVVASLGDGSQERWLVDFSRQESEPIEREWYWSFSPSFDAAFKLSAPQSGLDSLFSYYSLQGLELSGPVDETEGPPALFGVAPYVSSGFERWSSQGPYRAEIRDGRAAVTQISSAGLNIREVPGDYSEVQNMGFSPDGSWLYFVTVPADAGSSGERDHWISRISDGQPERAVLVSERVTAPVAEFSPSSRFLLISGYDSSPEEVVPFQLFDLRDPENPKLRVLDAPLGWAQVSWPQDSSYLALLGGGPIETNSRPLLVWDLLNEDSTPVVITDCLFGGVSCPSTAEFQPLGTAKPTP